MSSGEGGRVQVRDVVADDVVEVIAETLGVEREELTFGSSAENIAEWSSLAHLRVVEAVEQRFGVLLTAAEVVECDSVAKFVDIVRTRRT